MKSLGLFWATAVFALLTINGFAQESTGTSDIKTDKPFTCGKNIMTEQHFDAHPGLRESAAIAAQDLENFTRNFQQDAGRGAGPLIIPVVFHVIHEGGQENISNAQIESAIEVLNEDYSASTPGINTVNAAFADVVGDINFEFRLARLDPEGNCTNGIVRVFDNGTNQAGENLKSISPSWGRDMYLNVWVCASIASGAAGYAFLPTTVFSPASAPSDGIVILHDYVGRIGTGNNDRKSALTHEVGHWANLEHTWGPTNDPGIESNCNFDDGVADTPETKGNTTCPSNPISCGTLDNIENFMDYAYCYKMFTAGQGLRMNSTMNSFTSDRKNLWSDENLAATGVDTPDILCSADFEATTPTNICQNQTIDYQDLSFNGVQTYSWTFEGGTPATSTIATPSISYNSPGVFQVSLTVSSPNGSLTVTKDNYITVQAAGQNATPFMEGFEAFTSLEPNDQSWVVVNPDGDNVKWELTEDAAYGGIKSAFVRGRLNTNDVDNEFLISPTYDLSNVSEAAVLQFRYAHARRTSNTNDLLRVWISKNCGEDWSLRKTISPDDLPTVVGNVTGQFTPAFPVDTSEWDYVEIDNISSVFLNDEFKVRFEFESENGNNFYLDNIRIADIILNVGEIDFLKKLSVYPNPSNSETSLSFSLEKSSELNIDILDLTGRSIATIFKGRKSAGNHIERFDVGHLAQGVYVVRVVSEGQQVTRKVSVL